MQRGLVEAWVWSSTGSEAVSSRSGEGGDAPMVVRVGRFVQGRESEGAAVWEKKRDGAWPDLIDSRSRSQADLVWSGPTAWCTLFVE